MFIDIHAHARREPGPRRGGHQIYSMPEQLIKQYNQLGIEKGILLPGVNPECSFVPQSNEEIIGIGREYKGRFIPFCNIDPRAMTNSPKAEFSHILNHYKEAGCKGIGEICANLPFADSLVQNLFKHVEMVGFPLTFHIAPAMGGYYGLYDEPGLPQLERSLASFPKLKFFGHSKAFWAEIGSLREPGDRDEYPMYPVGKEGAVPRLMRKYPNLYGDLSAGSGANALSRDPEYAVKFLEEFSDRLMFGTDICRPGTPTPLVDFLLKVREDGKISEEVFQKVARENAIRILKLNAADCEQ
jgi:uncharacterized protein